MAESRAYGKYTRIAEGRRSRPQGVLGSSRSEEKTYFFLQQRLQQRLVLIKACCSLKLPNTGQCSYKTQDPGHSLVFYTYKLVLRTTDVAFDNPHGHGMCCMSIGRTLHVRTQTHRCTQTNTLTTQTTTATTLPGTMYCCHK